VAEAHLMQADLTGAALSGARLRRANLRYVNFTGADLSGADLTGADVDSADFVDTRMDDVVLEGIEGLEDAYVVSILTPDGRLSDEAALAWLLARVA
jgi:uncharacterized protein YjbI with pentapeptide repeats